MRRSIGIAALGTLCVMLPAVAQKLAQATTYNIELVVFRNATATGGAENWTAQTPGRRLIGDEAASGSTQTGRFTAILPPAQFQLNDVVNKLKSTGVYVPLAHIGWTQSASAWGTRAGFPVERLGLNVTGLTGRISLERGQYLHLDMALSYTMADPPSGGGASPGTTFTLNESRRVRFYERNYYDHPAFGVIALVTPSQAARAPGR